MQRLLLALCVLGPSLLQAQATLSSAERDLYAQLIAMADARRLDTAVVDAAIASASEPVAAFAALSLGQVGAEAAAPRIVQLRALLADPRPTVAASAAYALGLVRDSVSVPALAAAVTSGDERRALEAAWSLGQIGEPARTRLIELLSGSATAGVRVQLLLAGVKLRPVPIESVLPHLHSASGSVAWAAAYAIARPRVPEGVQALIDAVSFPTARDEASASESGAHYDLASAAPHRIRAEIARVLTRPATGGNLADTAFTLVARLATDPHQHVRINALRSIATYGDRALPVVVGAAGDPDPNVRLAAVQAIATAEASSPDWIALWIADTTLTYRRYVLEAQLARGGWSSWIARWAGSSDSRHRAAVAGALGGSRLVSTARPLLLRLADDSDARVRAAAVSAIAADSARITSEVRELLRLRLADGDEYVRAAATAGLARAPRADDLAAVVEGLSRALADRDSDARTAALRYLAAAWRRDSASFSPAMQATLGRMSAPADASSRVAASVLPPLAHWGGRSPLRASWPGTAQSWMQWSLRRSPVILLSRR
jgi:HEAT repeat protein